MLFNPINTNHESSIISFSYPKHIIAHITGLTGSKKYFLSVLFEINSCMTGKLNASFAFMPKLTFSLLPQDFTGFLMKEKKKKNKRKQNTDIISLHSFLLSFAFPPPLFCSLHPWRPEHLLSFNSSHLAEFSPHIVFLTPPFFSISPYPFLYSINRSILHPSIRNWFLVALTRISCHCDEHATISQCLQFLRIISLITRVPLPALKLICLEQCHTGRNRLAKTTYSAHSLIPWYPTLGSTCAYPVLPGWSTANRISRTRGHT